jgi:hypothetical protein
MSKMIDRDELVKWLSYWQTEQAREGRLAEASELEFVIKSLQDEQFHLLKEVA